MEKTDEKTARTSGDGMDCENSSTIAKIETNKVAQLYANDIPVEILAKEKKITTATKSNIPGLHYIYRPPNMYERLLPPKIPKGTLFLLTPRTILPELNDKPRKKVRIPKFVPMEPYTAAVNFMVKPKNRKYIKINRNNVDINILVWQMSNMKTNELKNVKANTSVEQIEDQTENKIKKLMQERDYYKNQVNFQTQVNYELKHLLVAAVGEDLQTRVNVLTEDKLQLAQALMDSANNLSTHSEQVEFLANQCEVWRSKFLASSVLIEELARWKTDLSHKNGKLVNANRQMLDLFVQIRKMQLELLKNLKFLNNIANLNLSSADVHSLTAECLNISQQLVLHAGFGVPNNLVLNNLPYLTEAEKSAIEILKELNQQHTETDHTFSTIIEQVKKKHDS